MAVTVDIPGVGTVVADNAATEKTLQDILKALKGGSSSQGGGGGGSAVEKTLGPNSPLGQATKKQGTMMGAVGQKAGKLVAGFAKLGAGALNLVGTFVKVGEMAISVVSNIAELDNNVTKAASSIPILGGVFGKVAAATEKMVNAVQSASASGASFGGQVQNMTRAAAGAGMTLDQYTKFVASNGEAFRLLGGDVEAGRRRFESLSKEMRTSGMMQQLNALGYTSEQVNVGMARYTRIVGQTGKLQNMSTAQLAERSSNYMREIDKLAKATGQEREQIEENQAKLLRDAQYQAAIARLGVEEADALRNTITGLPEGLQGVAKDIISTGTATTKESEEFAALMPRSAAMMQRFARITEQGGMITADMQQELQNVMRTEGQERKIQYQNQGRYNSDLADSYMRIVDASNIQQDALTNATDSQNEQIAVSDGVISGFESMRRRINEISIEFLNFLQSTGLLDSMMTMFEGLTSLIRTVVMPVIEVFAMVLKPVITILATTLSPLLDTLGFIIGTVVMPPLRYLGSLLEGVANVFNALYELVGLKLLYIFNEVVYHVKSFFQPAIDFMGRMISSVADFFQTVLIPPIESAGGLFSWIGQKIADFGAVIGDYISPIFETLYNFVSPVIEVFSWLYEKVSNVFDAFRSLDDIIEPFRIGLEQLSISFQRMKIWVEELMSWNDTAEEEEDWARRRAELDERQDALNVRSVEYIGRLSGNIVDSQAEREEYQRQQLELHNERQGALQEEINASSARTWNSITDFGDRAGRGLIGQYEQIGRDAANTLEEKNNAISGGELDYSNSLAVLQNEITSQGSYLRASVPESGVNSSSSTGTSALTNAPANTSTDTSAPGTTTGTTAPGTQTTSGTATPGTTTVSSAREDVFNTLNSNVETLINLQRQGNSLLKAQLGATKGLQFSGWDI